MEKTAAASETMSQQADGMRGLVSFFTVDGIELSTAHAGGRSSEIHESVSVGAAADELEEAAEPVEHTAAPAGKSSAPARHPDAEWAEF